MAVDSKEDLVTFIDVQTRKVILEEQFKLEKPLRPGSTYRNLNPYEVLQIDPETPIEDIRRKYRRLSILVHPDKNPR